MAHIAAQESFRRSRCVLSYKQGACFGKMSAAPRSDSAQQSCSRSCYARVAGDFSLCRALRALGGPEPSALPLPRMPLTVKDSCAHARPLHRHHPRLPVPGPLHTMRTTDRQAGDELGGRQGRTNPTLLSCALGSRDPHKRCSRTNFLSAFHIPAAASKSSPDCAFQKQPIRRRPRSARRHGRKRIAPYINAF